MVPLGPEYIGVIRDTLTMFHEEAGRFIQDHDSLPVAGSQALTEQSTYARPDSIVSACAIASQLIEYGGDHVTAFVKLITEPVEVIACWTCVRSMLEPCALASWVADPSIDAHTRVGRVFALRYEGMEQQLKFGRVAKKPESELKSLEDRIDQVEKDALGLGFPLVQDRKKRRIGIAQRMPSATDMIKMMLNEEEAYRMLSAVAHGHNWAILKLGFKAVGDPSEIVIGGVAAKRFEKTASLQGFAYLGVRTAKAFASPLWNVCQFFGWDKLRLEELFETVFDKLQVKAEARFWRDYSIPPAAGA